MAVAHLEPAPPAAKPAGEAARWPAGPGTRPRPERSRGPNYETFDRLVHAVEARLTGGISQLAVDEGDRSRPILCEWAILLDSPGVDSILRRIAFRAPLQAAPWEDSGRRGIATEMSNSGRDGP